jgi:intermediate cleaving peptidase 55
MFRRIPKARCLQKIHSRSLMSRPEAPFTAGQPLFETRPFMLKPGELTPGITALEYFNRRIDLANKLQDSSIAIVVGSTVQYASGSVFHPFQQNNDLFYLSGWNEPDSVLVIEKPDSKLNNVMFHMIVPPKEPHVEQWEGQRTGIQGAIDIFNADYSEDTYRVGTYVEKLIKRNKNIYFDKQKMTSPAKSISNTFQNFFSIGGNSKYSSIEGVINANSTGKAVKPLSHLITDMRAIKSDSELRVMRKAGQISGRAYNQAYAKNFLTERTLKAFLEYRFIAGGCDKSAYVPVVATGKNALCIHYTRNDDTLYADEMVLVDAAGSLGGYCADISRTWPNSGKFTKPQADLYQAVLNVEKTVIEQCTESAEMSIQDLHDLSISHLKTELKNAGLGDLTTLELTRIYPHFIGHNLGLDVHDVPSYSRSAKLKAGQVVTVEPGIYIPDDLKYPAHFRNIGIRIEDDIAVGVNDYTNLTVEAAKEIVDIERVAEIGVTTPLEDEVLEVF